MYSYYNLDSKLLYIIVSLVNKIMRIVTLLGFKPRQVYSLFSVRVYMMKTFLLGDILLSCPLHLSLALAFTT